jgi:hypothetical protein
LIARHIYIYIYILFSLTIFLNDFSDDLFHDLSNDLPPLTYLIDLSNDISLSQCIFLFFFLDLFVSWGREKDPRGCLCVVM